MVALKRGEVSRTKSVVLPVGFFATLRSALNERLATPAPLPWATIFLVAKAEPSARKEPRTGKIDAQKAPACFKRAL